MKCYPVEYYLYIKPLLDPYSPIRIQWNVSQGFVSRCSGGFVIACFLWKFGSRFIMKKHGYDMGTKL